MDRLLAKHELYCTVCENNNGDCTLHNTMVDMQIPIQRYEFQRKPYPKDTSSPFYTYDPDQCILCGRSAGIRQQRTPLAGPQLPL